MLGTEIFEVHCLIAQNTATDNTSFVHNAALMDYNINTNILYQKYLLLPKLCPPLLHVIKAELH
jgi:hypothetical protein